MTVSSSSSKGRHYGRFTPREEVGEVTHWQFGDVTRPEVWQPLARLHKLEELAEWLRRHA